MNSSSLGHPWRWVISKIQKRKFAIESQNYSEVDFTKDPRKLFLTDGFVPETRL